MPKLRIEGSFVESVTPFDVKSEVDFGAFRALIEHMRDHGTRAILYMGSTGEPTLLSPEEKRRIVVETVKMRPAAMEIPHGMHLRDRTTGN